MSVLPADYTHKTQIRKDAFERLEDELTKTLELKVKFLELSILTITFSVVLLDNTFFAQLKSSLFILVGLSFFSLGALIALGSIYQGYTLPKVQAFKEQGSFKILWFSIDPVSWYVATYFLGFAAFYSTIASIYVGTGWATVAFLVVLTYPLVHSLINRFEKFKEIFLILYLVGIVCLLVLFGLVR